MKNRKKKFVTAVILTGMSIMMLAGCGKKTAYADVEELNFDAADYVRLGDYKKLKVKYPVPEVTDEDVQMAAEELIEDNVEYTVTDRGAKEADQVTIDFTGTVDGEEFEGGSAEDYELILGEEEFLEEFEENLIGKKKGETTTFTVTFPEDYSEDLAGKTAEFTVTVKSVSQVKRPEYTEQFVAEVTEYDTIEAYEASVREELMASAAEEAKAAAGEDALTQAMDNAQIDGYPQDLYDACYADMEENYRAYAEMFGMEFDEFMSQFMGGEGLEDVTVSWVNEIMVSMLIADKEGFSVTDKMYQTEGEAIAVENGYESLQEYEEDYGKLSVMTDILRNKTIDFLYESSEIEEVSQEEYYAEEDMEDEEAEEDAEDEEENSDEDAQ